MRVSKYAHLKEQALDYFRKGGIPSYVIKELGIPKSTAHDWYKQFKYEPNMNQERRRFVEAEVLEPKPVPLPNALDDDELTDFALVRKRLREMTNADVHGTGAAVRACDILLKLIQIQQELPAHLIDGTEPEDNKTSLEEFKKLTNEEKSRRLRELLQET